MTRDEGDDAEVQLVAYLVSLPGPALSPTVIRRRLAETLPEFMIPSLYMTARRLPLNANGKPERRTMPPPVHCRNDLTAIGRRPA